MKPEVILPIFFIGTWIMLGIVMGLFYWLGNLETKRRWHPRIVFGVGGLFLLFIGLMTPQILIFAIPLVLLISFVNWKSTRFCPACSKTLSMAWSRTLFCSKCGARLDRSVSNTPPQPPAFPLLSKIGRRLQQAWGIFLAACIVAFLFFSVYDNLVNAPKAKSIEYDLEQEFAVINPLPGAVANDYHASHKTRQALVGSGYSTSLSYSEIRRYYAEELGQHGWTFARERETRDWGRDLGGRTAEYCKRDYRASLQYAGERADYGWVFALELSWGLEPLIDPACK